MLCRTKQSCFGRLRKFEERSTVCRLCTGYFYPSKTISGGLELKPGSSQMARRRESLALAFHYQHPKIVEVVGGLTGDEQISQGLEKPVGVVVLQQGL